jgi:hypothetical protein
MQNNKDRIGLGYVSVSSVVKIEQAKYKIMYHLEICLLGKPSNPIGTYLE